MLPSATDILRSCSFFRPLDPQAIARLAAIAVVRRFEAGEVIFLEGDPCPGVYAVGRGAVRVYKTSAGGKEHLLHLAEEGMTFAEVAAIGRFPCPAHATAQEETVCALLPTERFHAELESDHDLCLKLLQGMAGWVRYLVGLMEDIVLRDAAGRLARYLARSAGAGNEVTLSMLKKDLANHLNLTSETLSRTLRRLSEAGLIEVPTGTQPIRILDRAGLALVAEGE